MENKGVNQKTLILVLVLCLTLYFCFQKFTVEDAGIHDYNGMTTGFNIEKSKEGKFTISRLPEDIIEKIKGVSWEEEAPVDLEDLAYLKITYWGFDGREHVGELIVHNLLAEEVIEIFRDLYFAGFPIEKMRLIDEYGGDDLLSMEDNNTSAFNFRTTPGGGRLSKHSFGVAIDINPLQNPYIKGNKVLPEGGKAYLDREKIKPGMIIRGGPCYNAFVKRGWTWGGDWTSLKDYQHFEKALDFN